MRSIEPALAEIANAVGLLIEERQAYAAQRIRNMLNQDAQIAQDILDRQVWDKARKNA
jgi:pheromone shutdown protein TraB